MAAVKVPLTFSTEGIEPRDVVVEFDTGATVGQLESELRAVARVRTTSGLWLGDRRLQEDARLSDVGLVAGARVAASPVAGDASPDALAPLELAVVGGLDAGAVVALSTGETTIGRAPGCDLVLRDDMVSRLHAKVTVDGGGRIQVEDLDSANGTVLNGAPLTGAAPMETLDLLGIGGALLTVRPADRQRPDLQPTGDGRFRYNKPPRAQQPSDEVAITMPEPPPEPTGLHFPIGTVLAPLVLGPLYFLFTKQVPGLMILMLASPLIAGLNALLDQRSGRRKHRKLRAAYEAAQATIDVRLTDALRQEERRRRAAVPDPAAVRTIAGLPTGRLWERRLEDADSLDVRVGLCDQPARLRLAVPAGQAAEEAVAPVARMVPVVVPVGAAGVVGLAGPRAEALPVLRALLLQLAAMHSPNDLSIVVLADGNESDWEWVKWLPHNVPRNQEPCVRLIGVTARQRGARLAELAARIRDQGSRPAFGDQQGHGRTVVVLDGIRRLRGEEAVAHLLEDGPAAGVASICLSEDLSGLPAETAASALFERSEQDDVVVTVSVDKQRFRGVIPEGVGAAHAERVARALSPLFEVAGSSSDPGSLPAPPVDHLAILELPRPDRDAVLRRWAASGPGEARAVVGVDAAGVVGLDLVKDGPHALVAGTTGAGKSELLQCLVAALALANRPDALTFLLVDFKGRSAFKDCESLPHTVGLLSNLDGRLVERAIEAIQAELRWREIRFSEAGAKDFDEYERMAGGRARIPRLVVVVDELKELADAYGESIPRLNQMARLGRSLGVHLLLATQKPASVAGLADLRANTDLRICLRVQDDGDSRDLVGVPDAARISRATPGRCVARLSDGRILRFQSGYLGNPVGGPRRARVRTTVHDFDVRSVGDPPRLQGRETMLADGQPETATSLQVLVGAICDAAAGLDLPPPRRPWLPPLPATLTIDDARLHVPSGVAAFPVGLADLPADQRQEPMVLDFDALAHVLVIGRTRTGRTTVLRTLGGVVAAKASPADVHLYGLEFRRRALHDLERLPHCGGVSGSDDLDRMQRLIEFLQFEIERRGRVMGSWASLAEQRAGVAPAQQLPYVLVLCDNYESFYEQYSYEDGGRLVERFDWLLREGPARGVHFVVTTDQRAAMHRLAAVIEAQLVLRPNDDESRALGLPVRAGLPQMPPGRGFWTTGPREVQVALLPGAASGEGQAHALMELGAKAWAAAEGLPPERLPARVGAMPAAMTVDEAEALRRRPPPAGDAVVMFAVGGLDVAPLDVDLRAAGYTFVVAGPRGSGRSTALLSLVGSLLRAGGAAARPVRIVTPRRSPLRQLAGTPGVTVLTQPDLLATELAGLAAATGPSVLVVDDADHLLDNPATSQLDRLLRTASDDERLVVIGGTTVDLLRRFSGWTFEARQSRSGMILQPASAAEGELLDVRLPRSTGSQAQALPGRGVLAVRGRWLVAQVLLPAPPA